MKVCGIVLGLVVALSIRESSAAFRKVAKHLGIRVGKSSKLKSSASVGNFEQAAYLPAIPKVMSETDIDSMDGKHTLITDDDSMLPISFSSFHEKRPTKRIANTKAFKNGATA
eukprot:Filipodium_phascolosomae@DN1597_c1_g1_i1.p2